MFSQFRVCATALAAAALAHPRARAFSPDGGMGTVALVAGQGLNKDVGADQLPRLMPLTRKPGSRACCTRRSLPTPRCRSRCSTISACKPPITGSASPRRSPCRRAGRRSRPSRWSGCRPRSSSTSSARSSAASCRSLTWPARSKIAGDPLRAGRSFDAAEETLRLAAETRRAYIRAVAARQILAALGDAQGKCRGLGRACREAQADRRGEQARSGAPPGLRHRDGRRKLTGGAPAGRPPRRSGSRGSWAYGAPISTGCLPSALPPLAALDRGALRRSSRRPWTGGSMLAIARARNRGAGAVLWAHAQDAFPQRARRRRHLQDAEGSRASSAPSGGGFEHRVRGAAVTISAGRRCARPSSAISKRSTARREGDECRARKRARPTAPIARPTPSRRNTKARCCRCTRPSRRRPSCNITPCRSTPSRCSRRRGREATAKVASIEAKRNFWLAYDRSQRRRARRRKHQLRSRRGACGR